MMACIGRWADPEDYADFWCIEGVDCDGEAGAIIANILEIAASDIHSAIAAANACDCTFAAWVDTYLKKLNIIDAAIYHHYCRCAKPTISDDMRATYLEWVNHELELIRTGKKELCDGETGADFPAVDYAEISWTEFAAGEILTNEALRRR